MDNEDLIENKKPCTVGRTTYIYKNGDIIVREYDGTARNARWWDKHRETQTTSTECECCGRFTPSNKLHHSKSKKHIKYIETISLKQLFIH